MTPEQQWKQAEDIISNALEYNIHMEQLCVRTAVFKYLQDKLKTAAPGYLIFHAPHGPVVITCMHEHSISF